VCHVLEQRVADAVGDPTVKLPVGDRRIDDLSAVVNGDIAQNGDAAGMPVYLEREQRAFFRHVLSANRTVKMPGLVTPLS
jgi:hypothetical protein